MIKRGMRRHVVMHYFIVVFLTIAIVEFIFLVAIQAYHYNTISNYLSNLAEARTKYYQKFVGLSYAENEMNFLPDLLKMFAIQNTELQILNSKGEVLISSSGFQVDKGVMTSDVTQALKNDTGRWVGKQFDTGEQVMAVSVPLRAQGDSLFLLRYVTSLESVNKKIMSITLIAIGIGLVVLTVVLLISFGLANSIVKPLRNITSVSAEMAKGRFDVRVQGNYRFEMGELASTLNYMAEEIVRSDQLKNDFISSISHELRTPLTGIKGWTETIVSGNFNDPEETKLGMTIIAKETDRLIGLVEELLDFSRIQQKEVKLHQESVDIDSLVNETMLQLRNKAGQKQVRFSINVSGVPEPVIGDQNRLKQVFLNIMDNAVKFSDPQTNIFVHIEHEPQQCSITVRDTGIGIPQEHVQKVTEKFYQVNPSGGGTGLGLAITRELIEQHNGVLDISSISGEGTSVTVTLPKSQTDCPIETATP